MARKKATPKPKAVGSGTPAIDWDMPERPASQYTNHASIYRGTIGSRPEEISLSFWQVAPQMLDPGKQLVKGAFLGSYLMSRPFAEELLQMLAANLGYELSKAGEQKGGQE
jgi:hypothetical protein